MSKLTKEQMREMTRDFVRGAIKDHSQRLLNEAWQDDLPPPGHDRKKPVSTDASTMAHEYIQGAVFDGLEEMGLTADQADTIIGMLISRPDMLEKVLKAGAEDYKRKLGMTGRPKPRSV